MKTSILQRIEALGGKIKQVENASLLETIQAISFDTVLHFKPTDESDEPFCNFSEYFFDDNIELAKQDKNIFIRKAIAFYYLPASDETGRGQVFWRNDYTFTPVTKGTADYDEWKGDFEDIDLSQCLAVTDNQPPEFAIIAYSYGYPDHYFICTNDKTPENPTVFSTDHEEYFDVIQKEGTLEEFLNRLMTKEESIKYLDEFLLDELEMVEIFHERLNDGKNPVKVTLEELTQDDF